MTYIERLEKLIKDNDGVITTKMVETEGIHREYLNKLVKQGKLERVKYGIYISPDIWEDKMFIYQLRRDKLIYSHETALYLNGLTDRDPLEYSITVPTGYNTSKLKEEGFIVHSIKEELFETGIIYIKTTFGNTVKTYNKERTICDILRDRKKQDPAVFIESLKNYFHDKEKDVNKLMKYAQQFKVENILRPYWEVLI